MFLHFITVPRYSLWRKRSVGIPFETDTALKDCGGGCLCRHRKAFVLQATFISMAFNSRRPNLLSGAKGVKWRAGFTNAIEYREASAIDDLQRIRYSRYWGSIFRNIAAVR